MIRFYPQEEWIDVPIFSKKPNEKLAISNFGRGIRYEGKIENGEFMKESNIGGYPTINCKFKNGKSYEYIHRLVANLFLTKPSEDHNIVIHLDFQKKNNYFKNLRWVTLKEKKEHEQKSPMVIAARKKAKETPPTEGHKLTSTDVLRIKKKIWDPERKTRLKIIAKQFNISEMQLYRIKRGENWSHIRVPNEPEETKHYSAS